jgi:signal transduction histidine kinase/PAS domain-containing protein
VVTEALVRVGAPTAGITGIALLIVAVITGQSGTLSVAFVTLTISVVAFIQQRRHRIQPLVLLLLASFGFAVNIPTTDRTVAAAALPALAVFVLIGVFSLPRRTALWFAVWCGLLSVWSMPWLFPDVTTSELAVLILMVGGTEFAGFLLITRAADALINAEENARLVFDASPVATWEEDFTPVQEWLESLRAAGVHDLRTYLLERPDEVRRGAALIKIRRVNPAAARLVEAQSTSQVVDSFGDVDRKETELASFTDQFVAIWEGRQELGLDLYGLTLNGRPIEAVLHWSVPVSQGRPDLSRVIVAISDISPRKIVEERLAEALQSNQRLLGFEHAITTCSQALLLSTDEGALEVALRTLCDAIGAESAYLSLNVDDPELGPSFHMVNVTTKPGAKSQEDRVGRVIPWMAWPRAYEELSRGKPFMQIADQSAVAKNGISRLGVPIFSGDEWLGILTFEDSEYRGDWPIEAVNMLAVAAPMLSTYWERETNRRRLEELVRSKDRFVASVSHELRTPLSAVLGFAEELRNRAGSFQPGEVTEMLEVIADQSKDMADMVEDLLVAARAEIGTISVRPQTVYLRSQAEAALAAIDSMHTDRVQVTGGPGKAWADPTRTRQIIRNLLTNAIRYGGDKVVAEASSSGDFTVLSVRDNGPGLPQTEWERIFEPYQRAHDVPTQTGSIGLGLTVSRQLARLMGGNLTYRSAAEESIFELTLPASQPDPRREVEEQLAPVSV